MKMLEQSFIKRRMFFVGMFLLSINTAIARVFIKNSKLNSSNTDGSDPRLEFIYESNDLRNYINQIEHNEREYFKTVEKKWPELLDVFKEKFDDTFWSRHKNNMIEAIYKDTMSILSEKDAREIVDFFKTESGQKYITWKNLVQRGKSEVYHAIVKMSEEKGIFTKRTIDAFEQRKKESV